MSDDQNSSLSPKEINVEDAIAQLELSLQRLKERHQQIITDNARKIELNERKVQIKGENLHIHSQDSLKSELHFIEKELEEIEIRLESELFKWSSLNEPFWQGVRFIGIGVIIGWILKSISYTR